MVWFVSREPQRQCSLHNERRICRGIRSAKCCSLTPLTLVASHCSHQSCRLYLDGSPVGNWSRADTADSADTTGVAVDSRPIRNFQPHGLSPATPDDSAIDAIEGRFKELLRQGTTIVLDRF